MAIRSSPPVLMPRTVDALRKGGDARASVSGRRSTLSASPVVEQLSPRGTHSPAAASYGSFDSVDSIADEAVRVDAVARPHFSRLNEGTLEERWQAECVGERGLLHRSGFSSHTNVRHATTTAAPVDTSKLGSADFTWVHDDEAWETQFLTSYIQYKHLVDGICLKMGDDPERAAEMGLELVAKSLTYGRLQPHHSIPIPVVIDGKLVQASFTPILVDLKDGNAAFLFIPEEGVAKEGQTPILSFRGTCPKHASGTIRADGGFRAMTGDFASTRVFPSIDVGRHVINADSDRLSALLEDVADRYGKVTVTGHSLGGTLAAKATMEGENHKYIRRLVTFSAPGVTATEVEKHKKLQDSGKVGTSFATAYTTEGDVVGNFFGFQKFLGRKFVVTPSNTASWSVEDRHAKPVLGHASIVHEVRPTREWTVLQVLGWATGINVVAWVLSRIGMTVFSGMIEAFYASAHKDVTRELRHHIEDGEALALRHHGAHLTPVQRAHARANTYYNLFHLKMEPASDHTVAQQIVQAAMKDVHMLRSKRPFSHRTKRLDPESIGGIGGRRTRLTPQEAMFLTPGVDSDKRLDIDDDGESVCMVIAGRERARLSAFAMPAAAAASV